jgi:hypothetical protein
MLCKLPTRLPLFCLQVVRDILAKNLRRLAQSAAIVNKHWLTSGGSTAPDAHVLGGLDKQVAGFSQRRWPGLFEVKSGLLFLGVTAARPLAGCDAAPA